MNNVAFRRYDIARLIANVAAAKPVTDRSFVLVHKLNFRSWVCASNMQNEHFKTTKKIMPVGLTALWNVDFIQVNIGGPYAKARACQMPHAGQQYIGRDPLIALGLYKRHAGIQQILLSVQHIQIGACA